MWLASGRQDPQAPIGYVFVFFYGLERRVLHDAVGGDPAARTELPVIAAEVERLLSVYGDQSSFDRYAREFTEALTLLMASGTSVEAEAPPVVPEDSWRVPMPLRIGLGLMVRDGVSVPARWALAWALAHPQIFPRTPAARCRQEFSELFACRYRQRHDDGLKVRVPKSRLKVEYRPASSGFDGRLLDVQADLPDVAELKAPTRALADLVVACTDELDSYSRWLGRNPQGQGSLAALAFLPVELHAGDNPELERLTASVEQALGDGDRAVVDGGDLLSHWTTPTGSKVAKRDVIAFAQLLSVRGYGLEPDPRLGGPVPGPGPVVVFRHHGERAEAASPAYRAAATMVHLTAAVAAADGQASEDEQNALLAHLERNLDLTTGERTRLHAHLRWLTASQVKLTGLSARVSSLSGKQRQAIGMLLVEVAAADGGIDPAEVTILGKIYRLLGLDPDTVYSALHAAGGPARPAPASEPVVVRPADPRSADYAIPSPPVPAPEAQRRGRHVVAVPEPVGGATRLDPALIEAKLAETSAVTRLLAEIFTEDDSGTDAPPPLQPQQSAPVGPGPSSQAQVSANSGPNGSPPAALESGVSGLDGQHTQLLRALAEQEEWTRTQFETLAEEVGMLPDSALDLLNEAAYEHAGEPVVEGEDPLLVNTDTAMELLA